MQVGLGSEKGEGNIPSLDVTKAINIGAFTFKVPTPGELVPIVPLDELGLSELHF